MTIDALDARQHRAVEDVRLFPVRGVPRLGWDIDSRLSNNLDLVPNRGVQTVRGTPIDHGDHQVTTAAE